jgi:uncharacterized protein
MQFIGRLSHRHVRRRTLAGVVAAAMSPSLKFDPHRLDMAAFAQAEGWLEGDWPLARMPRLLQDALPLSTDSPAQQVRWSARGARRPVSGGEAETRLHLQAHTALELTCQRCLQPMTVQLQVQPTLRFVRGEDRAEALDEDSDEDVLALTPSLDLLSLVEDELILALPLVPRHDACKQPLAPANPGADGDGTATDAHPFAMLESLRRGRSKGN